MSRKKIRILQVNKAYAPVIGGIERVVQQIAEGLQESTDMKVLVCRKKGRTVWETVNGVEICRNFSLGWYKSLPIPVGFTRRLRKMAADREVLLVHLPFPFSDLACLLSGYKGKIVIWWHSDVVRQKKMMILYKPLMERFLKRADAIIVATEGHIEGSAYLKPYREKCIIVPFGVEPEIEKKADAYIETQQESGKEREQIPEKKVHFLFVGRLVYYKGCDVLLKAFRRVDNAVLTMVGTGVLEEDLKQYVQEHHMTDRVHFVGHATEEELSGYFADCDVFVLASTERSEAFGLVQIEAMAYGKPVINTNLPSGVPKVSLDGITGLTVPPGKEAELAEAMRWMVEHPEERKQYGRAARKRMKEEFRMELMLDRTKEALTEVINKKEVKTRRKL